MLLFHTTIVIYAYLNGIPYFCYFPCGLKNKCSDTAPSCQKIKLATTLTDTVLRKYKKVVILKN